MAYDDLDGLYRDAILDHRRNPRNSEPLEQPDLSGRAVNPFCGDEVDIQIRLTEGRVSHVGVQARGCSINQATASLLSEAIEGKTIEEIEAAAELFRGMVAAEHPRADVERLGDLQAVAGVRRYPVRIKCALLPWSALEEAVEEARTAGTADPPGSSAAGML